VSHDTKTVTEDTMKDEPETVGVTLRLPAPLRDAIAASAKRNRRSLNSEIVVMLEGLKREPASDGASA
jgi:hypothetical protein